MEHHSETEILSKYKYFRLKNLKKMKISKCFPRKNISNSIQNSSSEDYVQIGGQLYTIPLRK